MLGLGARCNGRILLLDRILLQFLGLDRCEELLTREGVIEREGVLERDRIA